MLTVKRSSRAAIDVASLMVAMTIVGLVLGVIATTTFFIIPWAQDETAKQTLLNVHNAQQAYAGMAATDSITASGALIATRNNASPEDKEKKPKYGDLADLVKGKYLNLQLDEDNTVKTPDGALCVFSYANDLDFRSEIRSGSGRYFVMDSSKGRVESLPAAEAQCVKPGDTEADYEVVTPGEDEQPGDTGEIPMPADSSPGEGEHDHDGHTDTNPGDIIYEKDAEEVAICHAKGNGKYNRISPSVQGILNGHAGHDDDIIPPIKESLPEGRNWTEQGQTIWFNDCVNPETETLKPENVNFTTFKTSYEGRNTVAFSITDLEATTDSKAPVDWEIRLEKTVAPFSYLHTDRIHLMSELPSWASIRDEGDHLILHNNTPEARITKTDSRTISYLQFEYDAPLYGTEATRSSVDNIRDAGTNTAQGTVHVELAQPNEGVYGYWETVINLADMASYIGQNKGHAVIIDSWAEQGFTLTPITGTYYKLSYNDPNPEQNRHAFVLKGKNKDSTSVLTLDSIVRWVGDGTVAVSAKATVGKATGNVNYATQPVTFQVEKRGLWSVEVDLSELVAKNKKNHPIKIEHSSLSIKHKQGNIYIITNHNADMNWNNVTVNTAF